MAALQPLEMQVQSARRNLLFLQQEHAATLQGLHAEIRGLQQRCTDLTFQLAKAKSENEPGDLQQRHHELEAKLRAQERENRSLSDQLEQTTAHLVALKAGASERERRYLEQLRAKSHKLSVLSRELEQKGSTIAYLTSQLHAAKRQLSANQPSAQAPESARKRDGQGPGAHAREVAFSQRFSPTPPSSPRQRSAESVRRRSVRVNPSTGVLDESESEAATAATAGAAAMPRRDVRPVSAARRDGDGMPDPTPFLLLPPPPPKRPPPCVPLELRPALVPPISPARTGARPRHRAAQVAPPGPTAPEFHSLAVEPLNGANVLLARGETDHSA